MTEAPALPARKRPATSRAAHGRRSRTATLQAVPDDDRASANGSATTGVRRTETWPQRGFLAELHCECGLQHCRETFPAVAERHRGVAGRLIVVPDHYRGLGTVLKVADRFFVVELNERSAQLPPLPTPP